MISRKKNLIWQVHLHSCKPFSPDLGQENGKKTVSNKVENKDQHPTLYSNRHMHTVTHIYKPCTHTKVREGEWEKGREGGREKS